ncbi:microtubule-associated protein futsch isoform X2 [Anopheles ziemanni]|uniref:microtubule-associated protein futsch isoform X2 n=1 Tax=Anopheles coustani TaxID=139045 RepID=UPI002658B9D4|nr:microtubule-associated protein futsch isoform X2 [Anopheles coustani]XP_058168710.1 microtubule-associated protein futsch isoform X2 [Anopheles ziemanni]
MFSCCRCVNPKSPKQKGKSSSGKGDKSAGSDDSHDEDDQRIEPEEKNTTSACQNSAVDNFSQDDEEIKIEIIENSDNQQSYSGSAATTAVLNGSSPEPKHPEADASPAEPRQSSPVVDKQPRSGDGGGSHSGEESNESNLADVAGTPEQRHGEEDAIADTAANAAGSTSSSPASKTLSNTERGQTDQSGQSSSAVVTEIETKLPNESTDAESTGDATNTPQEIPTTVGEIVGQLSGEMLEEQRKENGDPSQQQQSEEKSVDETTQMIVGVAQPTSPMRSPKQSGSPTENSCHSPRNDCEELAASVGDKPPNENERPPDEDVDHVEPSDVEASVEQGTVVTEKLEEKQHDLPPGANVLGQQEDECELTSLVNPVSDIALDEESLPPPPTPPIEELAGTDVVEESHNREQKLSLASKMERLKSEPSNSEETIEETIDVDKFLPRPSDSKSDDDNPLSSTSGTSVDGDPDGGSPVTNDNESSAEARDIENVVPPAAVTDATAAIAGVTSDPSEEEEAPQSLTPSPPDAAVDPPEEDDGLVVNSNDQVSKTSSEGRESNNDDTSTLSESVPNTVTNGGSPSGAEADNSSSRKESVNSDDTTIRTQVSFRESCLSRRSSSKSSIKKKVAYCDSTEVIPPPEYPPPEDDDSVFSDSVPPKLPRGDMCTPYATKRGSLPGMIALPDWFAEDRLMMEEGGIMEPPTTPIGRDELALRRHRFFSELLNAAHAAVEHRVRFDPLGPEITKVPTEEDAEDCDPDLKPSSARELEGLIDRLERIVDRLERTVSARELEETRRILRDACIVGKAVILPKPSGTNTQAPRAVETSAVEDNDQEDDLPTVLPSTPPPSASYLHQQIDSLESTLFPELTDLPTQGSDGVKQRRSEQQQQQQDHFTVIQTKSRDTLSHTNLLIAQEQGNAVLSVSSQKSSAVTGPASTMSIKAYDDILQGSFADFFDLSNQIGDDVATQAQFVEQAFEAQYKFLEKAATSSAPSNADLQELLKPTSDRIAVIQEFRERSRTSKFFNHLSAISESIPALGWVCVAPAPGPYVKEMNDAGQFYTNRVLKDWKEKNATHVEWARKWIQTLTELQAYIKQYHTTGLVWGGKNKPAVGGGAVPPPPPPGGMPPPPPMMPLGDVTAAGGAGDERSALFAQINQGADITKGLKKVTADMQTHKNPGLRSGPAPYKAPAGVSNGTKSVAPPAAAVAKPPTFTRDGKKWLIEYQKNNHGLVVDQAEMNNVVYMFRCEGSTLTINGKINSVVMDSCKKCSLVFDSLVASAEFVNCQSVQMQAIGKVPTISIDKTDGCQMYLSEGSLDVEIVSSKSSEMNVMIPKGNGDYAEQPIPEQFKTVIKGASLNTTCVESLG